MSQHLPFDAIAKEKRVSFHRLINTRYKPDLAESGMVNCERLSVSDLDKDGEPEIIIIRNISSGDSSISELAIYDASLNLKNSRQWNGSIMDMTFEDIDSDGYPEIVVAGADNKPIIRAYKYNKSLELLFEMSYDSPCIAKSIEVADINRDGNPEIIVLGIAEKKFAQIRIYDLNAQLLKVVRWNPMYGEVIRWGHSMILGDLDGDGRDELAILVNFDHNGKRKSDLRILDDHLLLKSSLAIESAFTTCMSAGDIDDDGLDEIVVAGGRFPDKWQGATSQIISLDGSLRQKNITEWRTLRHSWVWDIQITDVDDDGCNEIITYGGTSLTGRNQEDANIMGEINIRDGKSLSMKDIYIYQSRPGEDTRPSRGCMFERGSSKLFALTTSGWSRRFAGEVDIRVLEYKPGPIDDFSKFIEGSNKKDASTLGSYASDNFFAALALEALALCDDGKSVKYIGQLLGTENHDIFLRTVQVLRSKGQQSLDELRKAGFAIQDDWIIASPFDNDDDKGFEETYPPEIETDFDSFYAGKDRIVRWGRIVEDKWDDRRWDIYSNLVYTHFESFERTGIEFNWNNLRTNSVAYALTYVFVANDMEAQFMIGSSDGLKLWLNDELKFSSSAIRSAAPDQDIIPVSLHKGENKVMLKVANGSYNGWGFYFRVTDRQCVPMSEISYRRPDVSHIHNQMLTQDQLLALINVNDDRLSYLAAAQLASIADRRGYEKLIELLDSNDPSIQAKSALRLTLEGYEKGIEKLVKLAPGQDPLFQFTASYALERIGDERAKQFSIFTLKADSGDKHIEISVKDKGNGFRLSPLFHGEETSHVDVNTDLRFHLGDNISAKCASIQSFGIREPRYRAMGIGGIAIRQACDLMAEAGHTCSIVSTGTRLVAHRLYCQNGYFDRRLQWRYELKLDKPEINLAQDTTKIISRDYENNDNSDVQRLREQYYINSVGPTYWSPRSIFGDGIKVVLHEGRIVGYADVHADPFEPVADISVLHVDNNDFEDKRSAIKALLAGISAYSKKQGKGKVTFNYPSIQDRNVLIEMGYEIEQSTARYGWVGMFKIMELSKFLEEISELLSIRIRRSPNAGWCGSFAIKGSRLNATIVFNKDGVDSIEDIASEKSDIIISADDRTITSILSGDGDIWELYRQLMLTSKPIFCERIRVFLESLFPKMPCRQGGWW